MVFYIKKTWLLNVLNSQIFIQTKKPVTLRIQLSQDWSSYTQIKALKLYLIHNYINIQTNVY